MQSLQSSQSSMIQYTKPIIEEHFMEIEQQLESSYARIDELIDLILHIPFGGMNHKNESPLQLPQFIQFPINILSYSQQIFESVKPQVNKIIKNEIEIKDQKLITTCCLQKIINQEEETNKQNYLLISENDASILELKLSDNIVGEVKQEIIIQTQKEMNQVDYEQKQLEQQLMMYKQVEFNLIDDSNQQKGLCRAIVFNKDGSIMVSCEYQQIKIWKFEQGRFKLCNSYNQHKDNIYCLVYSKITNNFISGSRDHQIICWQQINQKEWKCSQPFKQHIKDINCLLLNKKEDQLLSGGDDHKIIVWKVDFIKNDLTFLYSLDYHSNLVFSLSFNQSETVLASCGFEEYIIWEKGLQGQWEFKYNSDVSSDGYKIHFINDQQFLWVTYDENDILVFELQNGVFKQNSKKTISLIKNNECEDTILFPIIHNKDRNVILVRHKYHIYLIRQLNDGTFNIIASLKISTTCNFGTMTNNGQYLVFWDQKYQKYSSYEILYK